MFRDGGVCNTSKTKKEKQITIEQAKKDINEAEDNLNSLLSDIQSKYVIEVKVTNHSNTNLQGDTVMRPYIKLKGFI